MEHTGDAKSRWARRIVGRPRLGVGVVWCCVGLAWVVVAVVEGPNVARISLGAIWLALGVLQGVVALLDRRHGRGFYHVPAAVRAPDEEREQD
jgi:hypothetical protein